MEQHTLRYIALLIVIAILIPVFVWLCYSVFPAVIETEITADGMLTYLGAIVGSIASLTLAAVAIRQNQLNQEIQEDAAIKKRQDDIRPEIYVKVKENGDSYDLILKNNSSHTASNIYLFDIAILGLLGPGSEKRVKFTFDETNGSGFFIDGIDMRRNEEGFPTYILLQCYDEDRNLLVVEYTVSDAGEGYIVHDHWYS